MATLRPQSAPTPSRASFLSKWGPTLALPALGLACGCHLPRWMWMWLIVAGLYNGAKWLTIGPLLPLQPGVSRLRLLAYLLFWPGMNARAFLAETSVLVPPRREWLMAIAKTLFGLALVWGMVPFLPPGNPLLTGWLGMVGLAFALHFGFFHLLSLLWRSAGINAKPLMRAPAIATSLSQFWGGRWNAAFSELMHLHSFKPLTIRLGARPALFTIFLISGFLHELVISLPADGGYGLPTGYFTIQGLALLFERSEIARRLGLGSGWQGWCFVLLVAGAPAFWLFHPAFIRNVILPMLQAIGAFPKAL